jgi:hypothetical protein
MGSENNFASNFRAGGVREITESRGGGGRMISTPLEIVYFN